MVLSQSQAGEGRHIQSLSLPAVGGVRRVAITEHAKREGGGCGVLEL